MTIVYLTDFQGAFISNQMKKYINSHLKSKISRVLTYQTLMTMTSKSHT